MSRSLRVRRARQLGTALAAAGLLAACGTTGVTAPGAAVTSAVGATAAGPSLGFHATTVAGAAFDASTLKGRPVALWFWAPWCTICRGEAPTVAKVAAAFDGRVTVIGVAGLGTVADMTAFVAETHTGAFTHLADTTGAIWREFGVVSQPSFVFIRPDGQADLYVGSLDESTLTILMTATARAAPNGAMSSPTTGESHVSDMMPLPSL